MISIVYLNYSRDLLKGPMKQGLYRVTVLKEYYFVVELFDGAYFMGENYWVLDYFMFDPRLITHQAELLPSTNSRGLKGVDVDQSSAICKLLRK
ncbi:hypothetical protein D0469_02975 [Peribacillus saganii]|uniref:Uncharacterized protein n=1 Tax=Peribacillus saganii TaxID=2303992 RepID=A0A372LRW2_9BACI|nr:hypothetical protein [Peribacillus saganii]RFU70928.1 hypothetical protein D0469_02975 [Peribacillus saganii]